MRLTIGNKIFAVAGSMTLIVAIAAMVSDYFIDVVNDEVERVAETYIPLSKTIGNIDRHGREQEILFQRLVRRIHTGVHQAGDADALKKFDDRGTGIETEYQAGLKSLQQAQAEEHFVDFKIELARLSTLLQQLDRVHQTLEDQNRTILHRLLKDSRAEVGDLLAVRLDNDLELAREVAVITHEVNQLTNQAARVAAKAEVWALRANIASTAAALLFGLTMAGIIARGLVRPIQRLVAAVGEVEKGNLTATLDVHTNDEIGNLANAFRTMTAELRIKEQIKDTFGKYVDPRVVESLTTGDDAGLGDGERRVYSVFFSDIAGFTGISEKLTPKALVNLINAYLSEMSQPIRDTDGVIDKYIGDAIMAYWGPPFTSSDAHAQAACRAALEQQARLVNFRLKVGEITGLRRDYPDVSMRIGIATGDVLVGSVGSEFTRNYTVLGDTVNLAARLEVLSKHYGTSMLISEETWQAIGDDFETCEIDTISVAGKTEPVRIFELLTEAGGLTPEQAAGRDGFEAALEHYRAGNWAGARKILAGGQTLGAIANPTQVLLGRLDDMEASPPQDWDGVWRFSQK